MEEASLRDTQLDKSTDFRGASLVNLYNDDWINKNTGILVHKGTDWRLGTYDETTKFGEDKEKLEMVIINAVKDYLREDDDPANRHVKEIMAKVTKGEPDWLEKVQAQLRPDERQRWDRILEDACKAM